MKKLNLAFVFLALIALAACGAEKKKADEPAAEKKVSLGLFESTPAPVTPNVETAPAPAEEVLKLDGLWEGDAVENSEGTKAISRIKFDPANITLSTRYVTPAGDTAVATASAPIAVDYEKSTLQFLGAAVQNVKIGEGSYRVLIRKGEMSFKIENHAPNQTLTLTRMYGETKVSIVFKKLLADNT